MIEKDAENRQMRRVRREFCRAASYAAEYNETSSVGHFFRIRVRRVAELLGDVRAGKVLDIGCGPAIIRTVFRDKPIEYIGVDVSHDMIHTSVGSFGKNGNCRFAIAGIENLGFLAACFDAVLCLGVLEYVLDRNRAMREVARVLKPDGVFIATMHNACSPYRLWENHVYGKFLKGLARLRRFTTGKGAGPDGSDSRRTGKTVFVSTREAELKRQITSAGLMVEDVLYYDFNLVPAPLDAALPKFSIRLSRPLERLCRSRLKFLGTGFIVKARKQATESTKDRTVL